MAPGNILHRNSHGEIDQSDVRMASKYAGYAGKYCGLHLDEPILKKIFIEGMPQYREEFLSNSAFRLAESDERSKPFRDHLESWGKSLDDGITEDAWEKIAVSSGLRARMCKQAKYLFGDNGLIANRLLIAK